MKNWIPNNKIKKIILGISATCLLLYIVFLLAVFKQIGQIEKIYADSESESSKEERSWALRSLAESNGENIGTLRNFFIRKGDEVGFIKTIEEAGRRSSLDFEINSIDVKSKEGDLIKEDIMVKINIEGSWQSIMNFVARLEKTSFGVEVQNLSIDAKNPGFWSGFIELVIFREK